MNCREKAEQAYREMQRDPMKEACIGRLTAYFADLARETRADGWNAGLATAVDFIGRRVTQYQIQMKHEVSTALVEVNDDLRALVPGNNLADIIGKWPGDETDEEVFATLNKESNIHPKHGNLGCTEAYQAGIEAAARHVEKQHDYYKGVPERMAAEIRTLLKGKSVK